MLRAAFQDMLQPTHAYQLWARWATSASAMLFVTFVQFRQCSLGIRLEPAALDTLLNTHQR